MFTSRRSLLRLGMGLGVGAGVAAMTGCGQADGRASASGRTGPASLPGAAGARRLTYGRAASQWVDVAAPPSSQPDDAGASGAGSGPASALVILVHGGFWLDGYGADLMTPLALDLLGRGYAVANLEYRRLGEDGGGWPGTLADVAAGIDRLTTLDDELAVPTPSQVITVGHSAGGQLALWAAGRHRLDRRAPGSDPALRPTAAVSLAGVLDLRRAADDGVGGGVVLDLLGGDPSEVPERYAVASPIELVALGVPTLCVHGTADGNVPISQSEAYAAAATAAGDEVSLETLDGADHFVMIDPAGEPWRRTIDWIQAATA